MREALCKIGAPAGKAVQLKSSKTGRKGGKYCQVNWHVTFNVNDFKAFVLAK
jgi:hypothetical protein